MSDLNFDDLVSFDGVELPGFKDEEVLTHEPLQLVDVVSNPDNRATDVDHDYAYVRQALHHQSQMIMDMAQVALASAKASDSPRHVEVFAALMSQMTNSNKEILKIHKEMNEVKPGGAGIVDQTESSGFGSAKTIMTSPEDMVELFQRNEDD